MSLVFVLGVSLFFCFFDWTLVFFSLAFLFFCVLFFIGGTVFNEVLVFDDVSLVLVLLSILVIYLSVVSSAVDFSQVGRYLTFVFLLLSVLLFLVFCFGFFGFFGFYLSFEFVFLAFFVYLFLWGYSSERFQASFYMLFYTLFVSFPFFVCLVSFGYWWGSFSYYFFGFFGFFGGGFWWLVCFFVFFVKVPVFFVHLWLPKAHVEAPLAGSMILAGVLLKLGGYGFLRFLPFFRVYGFYFSDYAFSLGLIGSIIVCFICLFQFDFKSLVAYSSVAHMGLMVVGIFSYLLIGLKGGIIMMVGHGLVSSCLFFLLFVSYVRFFSRSIVVVKGLFFVSPVFFFFWFLFVSFNMGVPPFPSFFSEVFIFICGVGLDVFNCFGFFFIAFLSGVFCIYLFISGGHGFFSSLAVFNLSVREMFSFFLHGGFFFLMIFSFYFFF